MFSTNKAKQLEKNDVDFLEAGIQENVKFTGVRIGQGNRNNAFIEFSFEKDGKRFTHTEWEPIKGALSNEAFEKKQTNITARAVEIMRCFYDDAMLNFEGETYSEFRNKEKNKIYFAIKDGEEYKEIIDENKLSRMLKKNYKVKNNADIID